MGGRSGRRREAGAGCDGNVWKNGRGREEKPRFSEAKGRDEFWLEGFVDDFQIDLAGGGGFRGGEIEGTEQ